MLEYYDDETIRFRGKKKKRETVCKDLRRSGYACGICGSENICFQGVTYCLHCGIETEILVNGRYSWFIDFEEYKSCSCVREKYIGMNHIGVRKCLDCGAVEGGFCPNCGKGLWRKCWKHWDGRKYCLSCGFRT